MRFILSIMLLMGLSISAFADIKISGKILDYKSQKKLKSSQIDIENVDQKSKTSVVVSSGAYKVNLAPGNMYKITYTKDGYIKKILLVNTKDVPESDYNKSVKMEIEVDLYKEKKDIDVSLFEKPIGIADYDQTFKKMVWNVEYSRTMFQEIELLMNGKTKKEQGFDMLDESFEDEEEVPTFRIVSPYQLAQIQHKNKLLGSLLPISEKLNSDIEAKKQLMVGVLAYRHANMVFAKPDVTNNDFFENYVSALEKLKPGAFKSDLNDYNRVGKNQDSCLSIASNVYLKYNKLLEEGQLKYEQLNLFEVGGWLEAIWFNLIAYQSDKKQNYINFLGEQKHTLEIITDMFYTYGNQLPDRLNGLTSDFDNLKILMSKVNLSEEGELINSDTNKEVIKNFKATESALDAIFNKIKEIRANILN